MAKTPVVTLTPKGIEARLFGAMNVLLVSVILTVVDLVLLLFKGADMILFTISVPYYLVVTGLTADNGAIAGADRTMMHIGRYSTLALVAAVLILAFWVYIALQCRKKRGWMITALVLYIVDTLALAVASVLLLGNPSYVILDICIHFWIICLISFGIHAWNQRRNLDREEKLCGQDNE